MPKVIYKINTTIYSTILVLFLAFISVSISTPTYADGLDYNVQIRPSLNITVSSDTVQLILNPSTNPFDSTNLDVSVGTNNPNGYKLYINAEDDKLTNNTYSTYINTLSSSTTESTFPANSWGYRISGISSGNEGGDSGITDTTGTNFYPFVSGAMISSSSTSVNNSTSTLTFGSKVNYERQAGIYTLDFSFKALPIITTYTMKDISLDPTLCTTDPMLVLDSRDGQSYAIARLADGKCWMLQNLKLGKLSDNIALTSADSNVGADGFILSSNEAGAIGKFPGVKLANERYVMDKSEYYCTDVYGCYYNWFTATASSGTSETGLYGPESVDYSICPKGWSLPTGGQGGEFETLASSYGYNSEADTTSQAEIAARMLVINPNTTTENINGGSRPGLLLGGSYTGGGPSGIGAGGRYWTRTAYEQGGGNNFAITTQGISPVGVDSFSIGRAIRCLLSES